MDIAEWVKAFRELHEKARRGALGGDEAESYKAGRESLARALATAQGLTRQPGQSPREALRVARMLQVDLESRVRMERLSTSEISLGGFSARMARAPAPDEELTATVRLPGLDPIKAAVKVVGTKMQPGSALISFAFGKLDAASAERLEVSIFDVVLSQMAK